MYSILFFLLDILNTPFTEQTHGDGKLKKFMIKKDTNF